jgi:hypothetical protein
MSQIVSLPYHQPAFIQIGKLFNDGIRYELTQRFAKVRSQLLLERFQTYQVVDSDLAWARAKEVLDRIDDEMQIIISRRSVAYWLHLYRRVGVALSPEHEDKTDHVTTGLVRQIAELAIQKHGLQVSSNEFGLSDKLSPELILGGWMKKGLKALQRDGASGEKIFRDYSKYIRKSSTWVIRDFSKKDLFNVYAIEGAAYQYWRLTALLRSTGKGARFFIDEAGDWQYTQDSSLRQLIISIDERNERRNGLSSLTGIWLDEESLMGRKEEGGNDQDVVFFPTYNSSRVKESLKNLSLLA